MARPLIRTFVALFFLVAVGSYAHAGTGTAGDPFKIYMIVFRGCEEACDGFKTYLQRRRINAEVIVRDAAGNASRISAFVAEARLLKPDLIVTWGTTTAIRVFGTYDQVNAAEHITDIPGIFMIVSQPVAVKIVPNLKSSGRNLTGTAYLLSEETQLKAVKSYRDFKRIGFLYNPAEENSKLNRDELARLAPIIGYTLIQRTLPLDEKKQPREDSIVGLIGELAKEKIDLLYQGPDSFLNTNRDIVTGTALSTGIPTFAAGEAPVLKGHALFGVVNKYYFVGQFTAAKAVRILVDKVSPRDLPIELPSRFSYLVNMKSAKQLNLYPPMKILDVAEVVK